MRACVVDAISPHSLRNPSDITCARAQLPKRITALASKGELTFAACGGAVHVCKRAHVQGVCRHVEQGGGRATVRLLEVLGELMLSAADDGSVCVWHQNEYDTPQRRWSCGAAFTPTAMCHPPTYLNKVLLASEQGALQLWNLGSGTLVHTFAYVASLPCEGWQPQLLSPAPLCMRDVKRKAHPRAPSFGLPARKRPD